MKSVLLHVFHALPYPVRSLAASLRGWHLACLRYGGDFHWLTVKAREREEWSEQRWKNYREEALGRMLHHAATQVPFYREQWRERRRRGDRASPEDLENWPVLEKETVRSNPQALIADNASRFLLLKEHTSGTTGAPLKIWSSRHAVRKWYALFETRNRHWEDVSRHDRWALVGGQLVVPVGRRRPPFWVWNRGLNQLYMSAYHLAPDLVPFYLDALNEHQVSHVIGYTSALEALARGAKQIGWHSDHLKVVLTNAEPIFDHQRQIIESGFRCPVRETYGMSEMVMGASECEAKQLHMWPDAGILEVLDRHQPLPEGSAGDLVCTGLLNRAMPLVRYRIGDRGSLASGFQRCDCGRTLPRLGAIEGRADDVVYTRDGRAVGRLDPVFKTDLSIREAQIIQESLDQITVRYVPDSSGSNTAPEMIAHELRKRLGPVEVHMEPVDAIPRGPNGKFRAVISRLSEDLVREITRGGQS